MSTPDEHGLRHVGEDTLPGSNRWGAVCLCGWRTYFPTEKHGTHNAVIYPTKDEALAALDEHIKGPQVESTTDIFARHAKLYCEVEGERQWFATATELTARVEDENFPKGLVGEVVIDHVSAQFERLVIDMVNRSEAAPKGFTIEYTPEDAATPWMPPAPQDPAPEVQTLTNVQFWSIPLGTREPGETRTLEFTAVAS